MILLAALANGRRVGQGAGMKRLAFLFLTLAGLFWGLGFPLGKLVLRETDAAHMVLLRLGIAAIAALPFALRPAARVLFRSPIVLGGGVLYGIAFLIQFEGLARISVTLAALIVGVQPALIAIAARLLGERASRLSWVGVAAASLGAVLIAGMPGKAGSPTGVALSVLAIFIFLTWLFLVRRAPKAPEAMALPAVTVVLGALTVLPIALVMHGPPKLDLSPAAWAGVITQGVFCTFLATAAWQYGLARVGSAAAGVFINIEPLIGSVIGVSLFGDQLTAALCAGGALIIAGSFVVVLGERQADLPELLPGPLI